MSGSKYLPTENKSRQRQACFIEPPIFRKLGGIFLLLLFLAGGSGCSYSNRLDLPPIDLEKINETITRDDAKSSILEAEAKQVDKNERPKLIDLTSPDAGGDTPSSLVQPPQGRAKSGTGPSPVESDKDGILLNFDNADIFEVIQLIASTLNLNYIIDPQVKGVVNIHSGSKIPHDQLFVIFKKILHINNLDIRSEGEYDYIYVAKKPAIDRINAAGAISGLKDSPQLIIQIVPLMHLASTEVVKIVEPYLSAQGSIDDLSTQNTLLISDYESKIVDILRIIAKLDISPLSSLRVKLVRVDNAPLFDLSDELTEIFTALKINRKDHEGISVTPLERVNSLMLVSSNEFQINNALKWIREMDVLPSQDRDNIYIYNVRNSVASELSELINELLSEDKPTSSSSSSTTTKKRTSTTTTKKSSATRSEHGTAPSLKKTSASGKSLSSLRFVGEPVVFADDDRNIILIRALPADYSRIVKLMERLDNLPRQVLVEVMVAEIKLSNDLEFGIEWYAAKNDYSFGTEFSSLANPGVGTAASGFSWALNSGDVMSFLQALASRNDFAVLSSPQILVLNNEQATVNVGSQVPIATTVTENTTTTSQVDKTIQYKDTGVILEVTPQINYNGVILLTVSQTVSKAESNTTSDISSPVISTREIKTKLAVKDGQTILMGGMIDRTTETTQSGVPFLMDIPVLGNFFKYQTDKTDKTELIVAITPYVIESEDVLDQYITQFEDKIRQLRPNIHTPMGMTPRKNW
ncbi:MAG: type II secretion system secretin GspD [Desulfobulbaceae bacterium]|nr:type II secretion system secretin GspD [Desulfobulbaceae bacterium]